MSYHLGLQVEGKGSGAHLGASWRTVTGHTQLDEITATLEGSDFNLTWARSNLSEDERSERLYSISSNSGDLQARFGTRWFDLLQGTDVLSEVGIDNEALVIGAQLERNLGSATGFVGAMGDLSTGESIYPWPAIRARAKGGNQCNNPYRFSVSKCTKPQNLAAEPLFRAIGATLFILGHKAQGMMPPLPSLDCLLGCYNSDPDPASGPCK